MSDAPDLKTYQRDLMAKRRRSRAIWLSVALALMGVAVILGYIAVKQQEAVTVATSDQALREDTEWKAESDRVYGVKPLTDWSVSTNESQVYQLRKDSEEPTLTAVIELTESATPVAAGGETVTVLSKDASQTATTSDAFDGPSQYREYKVVTQAVADEGAYLNIVATLTGSPEDVTTERVTAFLADIKKFIGDLTLQ
jgi:hypothetical protein